MAQGVFPDRSSVQLRDVRVVRGVKLDGFDADGDRFTLEAVSHADGVALELRDVEGGLRYSANIESGPGLALAQPLNGAVLGKSPWDGPGLYTPQTLFHGSDFQVLRSIDGFSKEGARATLTGTSGLGWPGESWATDLAAVDGALQLAILCGLPSVGHTLPLRIGKFGSTGAATAGPIRCALHVRTQTAERVVCDIALASEDGTRLVDLVEVEMYHVPSGNTSADVTS